MGQTNRTIASERPELATLLNEILGDLAFLVSDDEPPKLGPTATWLAGEISYRGRVGGRIRAWCTLGMAEQLSANLLGLARNDAYAHDAAHDSLGEFLNVLCGALVTAWHGADDVFDLTMPHVRVCAEAPALVASGPQSCALSIQGEPLVCVHEAL